MSGTAVGRTAAALPWLCPNTDSLLRLAEAPGALARPWEADPAMLVFLLRFTQPPTQPYAELFCRAALQSASLPHTAAAFLSAVPAAWIPASSEVTRRCRAFTLTVSVLARRLAEHTRRASPERAEAVAVLSVLGWLAVAAIDSGAAAEPLHDPDKPPLPAVQADVWGGLDQNAIARRLATRWRLPDWIATILGNLCLPLETARAIVADTGLFAIVQLAAIEVERVDRVFGVTHGADRDALLQELGLTQTTLELLRSTVAAASSDTETRAALEQNPHKVPLVTNLLRMSAESRNRNGASVVLRLEERIDELHNGLAHVSEQEQAHARAAKLAALAELAAGAGHEINNPLAIISGNAQRLFRTEPDPDRGETLQTIIRQAERIAGIIRDLMQFARPPQARPLRCSVHDLFHSVREQLALFAEEKGVRIEISPVAASTFLRCDEKQIEHSLTALVRNGIEAAGSDGWVRVGCAGEDDEMVVVFVEDSGPGLSTLAREHCFDPFFCGRTAGRGRGLGLSTAWQFVRQNGGDLRIDHNSEGPTRFLLSLPRSITLDFQDRQSA